MEKVILIDWNSYGNMEPALRRRGYEVLKCPWDIHADSAGKKKQEDSLRELLGKGIKYVFAFNYQPPVSNLCQEFGIPYIAWIYDSPFFDLYDCSIIHPVNHVFVFDYAVYQEFASGGITTVSYMPLGVDLHENQSEHCQKNQQTAAGKSAHEDYLCDLSFVGSLYNEPKHRLYDKFAKVSPYAHGYLDAIIEAQKHVYGENFLERLLTADVLAEMQKAYPTNPGGTNAMSPAKLYADFVLSRQVTSLERTELLEAMGTELAHFSAENPTEPMNITAPYIETIGYNAMGCNDAQRSRSAQAGEAALRFHLYTGNKDVKIPGFTNCGPVDYYKEMPSVFAKSKINLNITLRSIYTGIPLRAFDIMGAGGFLLTNFQQEFLEYFTPGEDFVFFEDKDDMLGKIEYYLTHEAERREIAENGCRKVREEHNYDVRLAQMEAAVFESEQ